MTEIEFRDEVVTVKQFRKNGWLPEGHDGEFRYTHCFEEILPQADSSGFPVTGLTEEDERLFETKLNLPAGTLSRYNKDYWASYRIKIHKDGMTLNKKNPKEALTIKVLEAHQLVANSEAEKKDSPFAEYVLTSQEQEAKVESKKVQEKRKAYKVFGGMNTEDMAAYLKVTGKRPSKDASTDWLEAEIGKIIDVDPLGFVAVMEDPNFRTKLFIDNCLSANALVKSGSKYMLKGGDIIGYSIEDTIAYLKAPENQEVYITLKSKLEV